METPKVDEYMERIRSHREFDTHLTKEGLDKTWPTLSDSQQRHFDNCSDCQQLVKDSFPVLYVGPVHDIVYKEKTSNKASEFILEELESRFSSKCWSIWSGSLFLSSLTRKDINHVQGCKNCRRLIDYLSRSGGVFSTAFGGLHQNFQVLVDMNLEIYESAIACRGGSGNRETPERKNCWENCLDAIDAGRDRVILIPRKDEQTEHMKNCNHCQLVLQYHQFQGHSMSFRGECFDTKTWKLFPVYSKDDQADLEGHAFSCYWCSPSIVNRLKINFQRDQLAFRALELKMALLRNAKTVVRNTRRPVGDFISSWRFHFGGDGPFATRHPWSVWGLEDRMAKLVKAEGLSDKEVLYRKALTGEITLDELCNNFSGMIDAKL